jgi:prepilin-type N-terminal cleavage/methylation domain-containing protein
MVRKRGFTLIELLVVIAIIAVLMGILMPALRAVREQGKRAACLSHVKNLILGIHAYAADYDDKIPASTPGHNASWNFFTLLNFTDPPEWTGLGRLYDTKIITDPEIFYCPSQQNAVLKKGRYDEEDGGWSLSEETGNESGAISYMYGLVGQVRAAPELELASMKLSALKDRALICDTFMPFGKGPVWAHPKGLSTGFASGHVEFKKIDQEVMDLAADMESKNIDERDLFTAAMFELLGGKDQIMEKYFFRESRGQ